MAELAAIDTVGARMLETCILTIARTNEIINMRWPDINMDRATWIVPRELMKMDRDHVVPLSHPVMTFCARPLKRGMAITCFPAALAASRCRI